MPDTETVETDAPGRREHALWLALLAGLCLWVAWRLGAFELTRVVTVDGHPVEVPNVYAWVDHPFHAARAGALLQSLKEGELLRWIGNHQGGYPAEFYPLGVAWLDVALWALLLGSIPVIAVHKLAVILIFLLPAVSYWILARGDRAHPGVAVLATATHFAVPGDWLNGGYTELVGWGLVTNVAGGSLALLASASLARFVLHRQHSMGIVSILAAVAAACSNPRSLFALVIASAGVIIVATIHDGHVPRRERFFAAIVRVAFVGGLALLLAAPVVFALFRYNEEYFFLHYEFYEPITELTSSSARAVSLPMALLAVAGAVVALISRKSSVVGSMAATLVLYVGFTVWVAVSSWVPPLVEQLEAPRLMPFQRQLMIYLGAWIVGSGFQRWAHRVPRSIRTYARTALYGGLALATLVTFVEPVGRIPESLHGLTPVDTVGGVNFALFMDAVERADSLRDDGTSIFVVGNRNDEYWWHEQLWAPSASDAPFYYDDWLWFWSQRHQGPYNFNDGYYFPNPSDALTREYLAGNGIGVVMITDMPVPSGLPPRETARTNPLLEFSTSIGAWDIYKVIEPTSVITNGESLPNQIEIGNQQLSATFSNGGGPVVIRRNWFPRWQASANGVQVEVARRDDGYMEFKVPAGPVRIEVWYAVTTLDHIARLAVVIGIAGTGVFALRGRGLFDPVDRVGRNAAG